MKPDELKSSIDKTAASLRNIALCEPEGSLLGNEDSLVGRLGVSRVTVRQAARLLEREGVLLVRRGLNGGYFAARPSVEMVEAIVGGYLKTMGFDARYTGTVTSALWIETMREAANADRAAAFALVDHLRIRTNAIADDAAIEEVSAVEQEIRSSFLKLIGADYIELLIRINVAFARQQVLEQIGSARYTAYRDQKWHQDFVRRWKKAKLMELEAIADGDEVMAMMAARHARTVWSDRRNKAVMPDEVPQPVVTELGRQD